MWDSPATLNRVSDLLFTAALLLVLYGAVRFAIHQPVFALREIRVIGAPGLVTQAQVESIVKRDFRGTFFTLDIVRLRRSFENLPWVRRAEVRRQWPDRVDVLYEEHQPLARWGEDALVNRQGEVFKAAYEPVLPRFSGPEGASREVALQFDTFRRAFAAIGREPVEVHLSPRRAWRVRLDNGLVIDLGRDQVEARMARFLSIYEPTIAPLGRRAGGVDMRYGNGFAVRVPGLAQVKEPGAPATPAVAPKAAKPKA
jgi:cell division protein FtsQ